MRVNQMPDAAEVVSVGVAVVGMLVRLRQLLPTGRTIMPGTHRFAAFPRRPCLGRGHIGLELELVEGRLLVVLDLLRLGDVLVVLLDVE